RSTEATNAQAENYWLDDHEDGIENPADPGAERLLRRPGAWHDHDAGGETGTAHNRWGDSPDCVANHCRYRNRKSGAELSSQPARLRLQEGLPASLRQVAHPQDVALALGDGNHAARIEQVEDMACLDALVVGREHHPVYRQI